MTHEEMQQLEEALNRQVSLKTKTPESSFDDIFVSSGIKDENELNVRYIQIVKTGGWIGSASLLNIVDIVSSEIRKETETEAYSYPRLKYAGIYKEESDDKKKDVWSRQTWVFEDKDF